MAVHELNALRIAVEKEMLLYEEQFRELDVMIEADKNLKVYKIILVIHTYQHRHRCMHACIHTYTKRFGLHPSYYY